MVYKADQVVFPSDWTLCDGHENTDHSPIKEEAEDKVAPLQPPPRTRMFKPKGGLLERYFMD